jgi:quinol-cytochrome oxidoreductase complex cytochrome b subunit
LAALIIILLIGLVQTIVLKNMGVGEIVKNVAVWSGLAGIIFITILFLLNRPLIEELDKPKSLPNQATLPTPTSVPPAAGAPSAPPAGAAGL